MTPQEIEQRLEEMFVSNLKALEMEGGHALSPEAKRTALWQVKLYWRKLREIAEKVTDTEVRLNLPDQKTPNEARKFGIEGVVDIVRENDRVVMYDVKTHEASAIRAEPTRYQQQLNVYSYIWKKLRGERLDATAVICTAFPSVWRNFLEDEEKLAAALATWEPVIDMGFNEAQAEATIREFAEIVEKIENGEFTPPSLEKLKQIVPGADSIFAVNTCRNCDARFSCASYRQYALGAKGSIRLRKSSTGFR
jgi:hypothetical protein